MAQENVGINITVGGNTDQALGSLKSQLREATAEVTKLSEQFGASSKEAVGAAKRAAELKDRIGDAKSLIDAFNPDAKFKALTASLSGVAGGFSALQGATALFGKENEAVEKTLLKVQSAMALSQGLQAVGESIDSFKQLGTVIKTQVVSAFSTLRGALIATGIGALAIGIGLVAANFDKVKKAVLNLVPGLAQVGTFFSNIITKVTDFVGVTSAAERALASLEKTTKRGNEGIEARIKVLTAQGGKEKEIYALSKQQGENELNFLRAKLKTKEGLNADELKKFRDLKTDQAVLDAQENKRRLDAAKEVGEKSKAISDKIAEEEANRIEKQLEKEKNQTQQLLDEYDKRKKFIATSKILTQKEILALDEEDKIKQQEADNKKFDTQIATLSKTKNFTLQSIQQIQKANADNKEAEAKIDKISAEQKIALAQQTADALMAVSSVLGKETAAGKALAISAALINTYQGISAGVKLGFPAAIPAVALAAATGFSAVKNIIATKVPGAASGGAGNMSSPNVNATAPIAPPQPQAATTNISSQSINALGNQAIRSYVIESDVTSSQQRIAAIQQRARFG